MIFGSVRRTVAVVAALAVCLALGIVAVVATTGVSSGPQARQQQWGTASGRPHRVFGAATIAGLETAG